MRKEFSCLSHAGKQWKVNVLLPFCPSACPKLGKVHCCVVHISLCYSQSTSGGLSMLFNFRYAAVSQSTSQYYAKRYSCTQQMLLKRSMFW